MSAEEEYLKKIHDSILNYDSNIKQIKNLNFLKVLNYTKHDIEKINSILQNKKLDELDLIPEGLMSEETLILVKFYNQDNRFCVATIYDNDKLWQDPEVLEIHSL